MAISIRNLSFKQQQNDTFILNNLSLHIKKDEVVAIMGVSGSGKSTLLNLISSFYKPTDGNIEISDFLTEKMAYIRQDSNDMIFPWKTVKQNVELALKERGEFTKTNEKRVENLLKILRISSKKEQFPSELSGGELKRLSFACCLSYSPKLILLDEAFTGIDLSLKWELWEFLKEEIKNLKATVVVITHEIDEAIFLADKIAFLKMDAEVLEIEKDSELCIEKLLLSEKFISTKEKVLNLFKKNNETT